MWMPCFYSRVKKLKPREGLPDLLILIFLISKCEAYRAA